MGPVIASGACGVVDEHPSEQHAHGHSRSTRAKVPAREVFRPIATRPAAMPTAAATPSMTGTPEPVGQRVDEVGQAGAAEDDGFGTSAGGAGGVGERVEQVGRAVDQLRDRHVDGGHGAAVLEPERADDAVAVRDGAGGSVMTTNRCATRQAVCSAASVIPTTGQVATSRAAATPVSPKQATTNASVSRLVLADLLDDADGGDRLLGMALDAGHADRGVDPGDGHTGARDRLGRLGDGGRQLGGRVRVDHGDPRHRDHLAVTAASRPSMPGPPTAMRAARGTGPCRGVRVAVAEMFGGESTAERVAGAGAVHRFDDIGWDGSTVRGVRRVATRHPASASLIDHHLRPELQEGRGRRVQVGRAGQRGGLDLAGQEHVTARTASCRAVSWPTM